MALTKEEQAIQDSFNRSKAQQRAQRDIALREAAERLALQQSQTGELETQTKQQARQQATQTYVAGQQAGRVLPNQLAQGGLSMSGYRSLAQQKMAREQTVGQQGIRYNRDTQLAGYARSRAADQLTYDQNVRSANNTYNQNVANLTLDRDQALDRLVGGEIPTDQQGQFNQIINTAMAGGMTYDQFKQSLAQFYTVGSTEYQAYLQRYLVEERKRGLTPPINYTSPGETPTTTRSSTLTPAGSRGGTGPSTTLKY